MNITTRHKHRKSTTARTVAATIATATLGLGIFAACGTVDAKPVAASVKASNSDSAADYTYLVTWDDEVVQEPKSYIVDGGEVTRKLTDLVWSKWGSPEATATGTMTYDSRQNEGEGRLVSYPVTITAKDLIKGEASQTYSVIDVAATGDTQGLPKHETFQVKHVEAYDAAAESDGAEPAGDSGASTDTAGAAASEHPLAAITYVKDLTDEPMASPTKLKLPSGEVTVELSDLTWSNWGAETATATGLLTRDSVQNGSEGAVTKYKVTVTVSNLAHGEAAQAYTRLTVKRADGTGKPETFTLTD